MKVQTCHYQLGIMQFTKLNDIAQKLVAELTLRKPNL